MSALFTIQNLAKRKWSKGDQPAPYLFSGLSAEITVPDRIALIGASGQGKSTLLRMLALLEASDEGDVLVNGTSFRNMNSRLWRRSVCYVAQQAVMLSGTVEDNLRTVSRLHGTAYDAKLAKQLLERIGLDYLDLHKQAADCSGGEKQRIALIRSLLLRPSVLLLDEITASLDVNSSHKVELLLQQWHQGEGVSLIWVTHDLEQASRISRRTWFMGNGLLEEHLSETFYAEPAAELAQRFMQPEEGKVRE